MTDQEQELIAPDKAQQAKELMQALTKMAEANTKEQEVKQAELGVKQQEIESNERIALAAIEAQKSFHSDRWNKFNSHLIHRYIFICVIAVIMAAFAGFAINLGAKDLVMDMAKLVGSMAVGTFGGYHWGKSKSKSGGQDQSD
ncbi:Uncharacterised protein [Pseudomonas putida]|uniref:hypothetical protein n=1 Tax=Pseudomonas asiatica TaxID=2219225 RepID=UPI0010C10107|nr:hypothetical protein [Pseudomonas asiatica]CAB5577621.1 Uncharacterised protein [Pseudomonas putida]CAB5577831.1 Uncharacterised protein [Pseudomonas putida]CAB5621064.1 Uncharacterised protein [Pseudomonas putida]CAB5622577.1 Uncharacterised protein [Pseudomonas putida]CAB5702364.1 Uncharacterised protein [Pseudomonas putida]